MNTKRMEKISAKSKGGKKSKSLGGAQVSPGDMAAFRRANPGVLFGPDDNVRAAGVKAGGLVSGGLSRSLGEIAKQNARQNSKYKSSSGKKNKGMMSNIKSAFNRVGRGMTSIGRNPELADLSYKSKPGSLITRMNAVNKAAKGK